jgi:predicted esterase
MSEINEHRLQVLRTARYYTIGAMSEPVDDLWYVCHGYSELAGKFIQNFQSVQRSGRLVVAPEALMRYYTDHATRAVGATWMTSEDRLTDIEDYVRYLDQLHQHVLEILPNQPSRVRVLGFSQGTATVSRWIAQGSIPPGELILWGGSLPPDIDTDIDLPRIRRWNLTIVFGERDEFIAEGVVERERERLEALGIAYMVLSFDGGHRLDDATLRTLADDNRSPHT